MELFVLVLVNILTAVIMYLLFSLRFTRAVEKAKKSVIVDELKENIESAIEYINTAIDLVDTRTRTFYRLVRRSEELTAQIRNSLDRLESSDEKQNSRSSSSTGKKNSSDSKKAASPSSSKKKAATKKRSTAKTSDLPVVDRPYASRPGDDFGAEFSDDESQFRRTRPEVEIRRMERLLGDTDASIEFTEKGSSAEEIYRDGAFSRLPGDDNTGLAVPSDSVSATFVRESRQKQANRGQAESVLAGIGRTVMKVFGMKSGPDAAQRGAPAIASAETGYEVGNGPAPGFQDALNTAVLLTDRKRTDSPAQIETGPPVGYREGGRNDRLDISGEARSAAKSPHQKLDTDALMRETISLSDPEQISRMIAGSEERPESVREGDSGRKIADRKELSSTRSFYSDLEDEMQLSSAKKSPVVAEEPEVSNETGMSEKTEEMLRKLETVGPGRERNRLIRDLLDSNVSPEAILGVANMSMGEIELLAMLSPPENTGRKIRR